MTSTHPKELSLIGDDRAHVLGDLGDQKPDGGHCRFNRHCDDSRNLALARGPILDQKGFPVINEVQPPLIDNYFGEPIDENTFGSARLDKGRGFRFFPGVHAGNSPQPFKQEERSFARGTAKSYEWMLEELTELSFRGILVRPAIGDKGNNSCRAANDTDHECESDKRYQLSNTVRTSNANKISNCCTIFPTYSPIDAAGVSSTLRDATNSESGFSGSSAELSRDLPPDNSEEAFQGVSLPPFFFMCRINEVSLLGAELDTQQLSRSEAYFRGTNDHHSEQSDDRVH